MFMKELLFLTFIQDFIAEEIIMFWRVYTRTLIILTTTHVFNNKNFVSQQLKVMIKID